MGYAAIFYSRPSDIHGRGTGDAGSFSGCARRSRNIGGAAGVDFFGCLDAFGAFVGCCIEEALTEIQASVETVVTRLHCGKLLLCRLLLPQKSGLLLLLADLLLQLPLLPLHLIVKVLHVLPEPKTVM